MSNSQALCSSFKNEVLLGLHQFGTVTLVSRTSLTAPTTDTFKAALYLTTASLGASTTAYSATNEVSGTNYTAGGVTVTNANAPASGQWTPSASLVYTNVTLSTAFDTVLIYNSTQSNRAVGVFTFGAQTITAGTLTLTMPGSGGLIAIN